MTIGELGNGVRRYFNANPDRWLWREGLLVFGQIMIDIFHVEEFISKHKDYNENESLQDNIIRIYGRDAAHFVELGLGCSSM